MEIHLATPPPSELIKIISWWLHLLFLEPFSVKNLSITLQKDTYSCSILTINALAHCICYEETPEGERESGKERQMVMEKADSEADNDERWTVRQTVRQMVTREAERQTEEPEVG
ncbi:hypothetical protein BDN70DRAFT_984511 [Pholiota conissans]|uniref:Uncharacterized protein n=1 Tax=Pholiota conissans TaxID=109636 RepID=A0A9P6CKV8_9AGAR|nr:hypothetical protein BDN70DRAFT_984511 [Pholiota conissans]